MVEKRCRECGKMFNSSTWNKIYCGSKTKKNGCSYKLHLKRVLDYNLNEGKKWMQDYQNRWRKHQRKLNTPYAEKQRLQKRERAKTKEGKLINKIWRDKNKDKINKWNKIRIQRNKLAEGNHTKQEWELVKKQYNNCCSKCGISEDNLKYKYKDRRFQKLTKDHNISISEGGTHNINNIRPLCIGCNARKKNRR